MASSCPTSSLLASFFRWDPLYPPAEVKLKHTPFQNFVHLYYFINLLHSSPYHLAAQWHRTDWLTLYQDNSYSLLGNQWIYVDKLTPWVHMRRQERGEKSFLSLSYLMVLGINSRLHSQSIMAAFWWTLGLGTLNMTAIKSSLMEIWVLLWVFLSMYREHVTQRSWLLFFTISLPTKYLFWKDRISICDIMLKYGSLNDHFKPQKLIS